MIILLYSVSIIGAAGIPAKYGGFETLAENLVLNAPFNIMYTVFCSKKLYANKIVNKYKNTQLCYINLSPNGISSILYDFISMCRSMQSNVMLILGVSGCLFLPFIRLIYRGKIITNIDGLEWQRDKWNFLARALLHYSEMQAVKYSDVIIGDNKGITDYVKQTYHKDAVLIPYGGDSVSKVIDDELYEKYPYCKKSYAITVCRIEPENNIHKILAAFALLENYQIVMVGNWKSGKYGLTLKEQYSKFSNIHLLDAIYDNHEINWLRCNAALYIHGHSAGGTNPSLVEAMNLGLPMLAFDCVYNRETTFNKCLYWRNSQDIISLIINRHSDFSNIANAMKNIALREYTWEAIAKKYADLY